MTFQSNSAGFAHIGHVESCDGLVAWTNLLNYVSVTLMEVSGGSKTDFFNMKQQRNQSITQFAKQIRDAAFLLKENGHVIEDKDCADVLRQGFIDPSRDQSIKASLSSVFATLSFDALQTTAMQMVNTYNRNRAQQASALSLDSAPHYCEGCKNPRARHPISQCWTLYPHLKPRNSTLGKRSLTTYQNVVCYHCNQRGHYKSECPLRKSNTRISNNLSLPDTTVSASTPTSTSSTINPGRGGSISSNRGGRFATRGPTRGQGRGRSGRGRASVHFVDSVHDVNTAANTDDFNEEDDFQYGEAYMINASEVFNVNDPIPKRNGYIAWVLDSACTEHLTYDSSAFSLLRPSTHRIHVADNHPLFAEGEGTVSYFRTVYLYPYHAKFTIGGSII